MRESVEHREPLYSERLMKCLGARTTLVVTAFLLANWSSYTSAQTPRGLKPTPQDDYRTIPEYAPDQLPVVRVLPTGQRVLEMRQLALAPLPAKFDLSEYFPRPGRQHFNDCTAWAVARGVYTYQVGESRQQRPSEAYSLFSPTFIYPQINRGVDDGSFIFHSSLPNAVQLVIEQGCASEATLPYDANADGWKAVIPIARRRKHAISRRCFTNGSPTFWISSGR
jgi:hypothetical protein